MVNTCKREFQKKRTFILLSYLCFVNVFVVYMWSKVFVLEFTLK